jgi:hypothetical protein
MQNLRTGKRLAGDGMVREMDPDAGNREKERNIASEDAVGQKKKNHCFHAL